MKTKKLASLHFILIFSLFCFPASAKKEKLKKEKPSGAAFFSASPPSFDLKCQPGEKKTLNVKLTNPGNITRSMSLSPLGFIVAGSPQLTPQPTESLPPNNLVRHLIIESPAVTIPAHSYKDMSVTLSIPEGLTGSQYVGLSAAITTEEALSGVDIERKEQYQTELGIGITPALTITIKCDMVGTLKPAYSLLHLQVTPARGNQPVGITASVKNTGNSELLFVPLITLMDSSKKLVARLKAKKGSVMLFPASTANVEMAPVFTRIPPGTYNAILTLASSEFQLPPTEKTVTIR